MHQNSTSLSPLLPIAGNYAIFNFSRFSPIVLQESMSAHLCALKLKQIFNLFSLQRSEAEQYSSTWEIWFGIFSAEVWILILLSFLLATLILWLVIRYESPWSGSSSSSPSSSPRSSSDWSSGMRARGLDPHPPHHPHPLAGHQV